MIDLMKENNFLVTVNKQSLARVYFIQLIALKSLDINKPKENLYFNNNNQDNNNS